MKNLIEHILESTNEDYIDNCAKDFIKYYKGLPKDDKYEISEVLLFFLKDAYNAMEDEHKNDFLYAIKEFLTREKININAIKAN